MKKGTIKKAAGELAIGVVVGVAAQAVAKKLGLI